MEGYGSCPDWPAVASALGMARVTCDDSWAIYLVRPALMLAGMAISIFAGGGTRLCFIISTNVCLVIERFKRSLNFFSSPMVDDTLPL